MFVAARDSESGREGNTGNMNLGNRTRELQQDRRRARILKQDVLRAEGNWRTQCGRGELRKLCVIFQVTRVSTTSRILRAGLCSMRKTLIAVTIYWRGASALWLGFSSWRSLVAKWCAVWDDYLFLTDLDEPRVHLSGII